nr:SIS domain-containing protein [Paenibacillus larvae]
MISDLGVLDHLCYTGQKRCESLKTPNRLGISSSGSTKDLMDAVQIAKANGDLIICLTNHARSPITHHADVVLLVAAKETPLQGGAFSSKLAQIHVMDILSTAIAIRQKDHTYTALEKTAKSVLDKLY